MPLSPQSRMVAGSWGALVMLAGLLVWVFQ